MPAEAIRVPAEHFASFDDLLDALAVPRNRVLYVQSSIDWVGRAGFDGATVMDALKKRIGPAGTLVMPSYPTALPHAEYLATRPTFDVRRSATVSGLLAEMLRRTAGAKRSLDPDFPICGLGPDADDIAGGLPGQPDPFGTDSPYQRMLDRHAVLVGLGVSLNTSSFIHVIDSRATDDYPSSAYEPVLFDTTVVDRHGGAHLIRRRALRGAFQKLTAPAAVIDVMQPGADVFQTLELNAVRFFRWDLDAWSAWCLGHARAQATAGRWPCWLSRLSDAA
jgi:aminoglycoside N3'-acetyltransferase